MRYSAALLILFFLAGCKGPAEPDMVHYETIHIGGQVTDADGTPLRGARLRLYSRECWDCTWTEGESVKVVYARDSSDVKGQYWLVAEAAKCIYDNGPHLEATYGYRHLEATYGDKHVKCIAELQVIDFRLPK